MKKTLDQSAPSLGSKDFEDKMTKKDQLERIKINEQTLKLSNKIDKKLN
jgi:hypothetical protein